MNSFFKSFIIYKQKVLLEIKDLKKEVNSLAKTRKPLRRVGITPTEVLSLKEELADLKQKSKLQNSQIIKLTETQSSLKSKTPVSEIQESGLIDLRLDTASKLKKLAEKESALKIKQNVIDTREFNTLKLETDAKKNGSERVG